MNFDEEIIEAMTPDELLGKMTEISSAYQLDRKTLGMLAKAYFKKRRKVRLYIAFKAYAFRDREDAEPSATGHAFELKAASYVNKTSYIENAETSAVGRALALLGYEIQRGIASREEMAKVKRHESAQAKPNSSAEIIDRLKQDEKTALPMHERIIKAQQAIKKLGGNFGKRAEGETDEAYLESLTEQYKQLKKAQG